jgi:ATP-dependent Zn protease
MTKREKEELKETAYHEAGHAVANFAMGKRFKKVSIIPIPEQDSLGGVSGCGWESKLNPELNDTEQLRIRRMVEREIITSFAGVVAEAKLTGRYNHIGASQDYHDAVFYASYVTGSTEETEAYLTWLLEKTKISFGVVGMPLNY